MKKELREKLKEAKTDLILQAVSEYFEQTGFEETTMQEIASAVGVSVGALYKLFPSKEDLFYAYISYEYRHFVEELRSRCSTIDDARSRLLCYLQLKFASLEAKRGAVTNPLLGDPLFFLKMHASRPNPSLPIYRFLAEQFERLGSEEPLRFNDPLKAAYLFASHSTGYVEHWLAEGGDLPSQCEEALESFLHGVAR